MPGTHRSDRTQGGSTAIVTTETVRLELQTRIEKARAGIDFNLQRLAEPAVAAGGHPDRDKRRP